MKKNYNCFTKQQLEDSQLNSAMDIEGIRRDLYNNFYEELEATICSIMAAGVPLSSIRVSSPKTVMGESIIKLQSHIRFTRKRKMGSTQLRILPICFKVMR